MGNLLRFLSMLDPMTLRRIRFELQAYQKEKEDKDRKIIAKVIDYINNTVE